MMDKLAVSLRFAADDEMSKTSFQPTFGVVNIRYAGVHPKYKIGILGAQLSQGCVIVTLVFDGIEIRDIECLEGKNRQQAPRDVVRSARRGQWGFDGCVGA